MNKTGFLILIITWLILFSNCKKEEDSWNYCDNCTLEEWAGDYNGTGNYFSDSDSNSDLDVPVVVLIETGSGNLLKTKVTVEDRFMVSFTSLKNDSSYFYEVPGTNKSLSLSLSRKNSEYKLSGTAKSFHYQSDTLFIDHSVSFEVFR